jgi:hypothetical protein
MSVNSKLKVCERFGCSFTLMSESAKASEPHSPLAMLTSKNHAKDTVRRGKP